MTLEEQTWEILNSKHEIMNEIEAEVTYAQGVWNFGL
jgi:hypothetical protein